MDIRRITPSDFVIILNVNLWPPSYNELYFTILSGPSVATFSPINSVLHLLRYRLNPMTIDHCIHWLISVAYLGAGLCIYAQNIPTASSRRSLQSTWTSTTAPSVRIHLAFQHCPVAPQQLLNKNVFFITFSTPYNVIGRSSSMPQNHQLWLCHLLW